VRQLADVLSLQLPQGLDYRDVLVQAQSRLADVAADVAGDMVRRQQEQAQIEESLLTELKTLSESLAEPPQHRPRTSTVAAAAVEADPLAGGVVETAVATRSAPARTSDPPAAASKAPRQAPQRAAGSARMPADSTTTLLAHLESSVAACRQARCSLSLLLLEINPSDQVLLTRDSDTLGLHRRLLMALCEKMEHPGMACFPQGDYGLAVVLPDCDRRQVVEMGNLLIDDVRRVSARAGSEKAMTVSSGAATVALPPKNFPAEDLFRAASRCLNGSRTTGGSVLKSIEIY